MRKIKKCSVIIAAILLAGQLSACGQAVETDTKEKATVAKDQITEAPKENETSDDTEPLDSSDSSEISSSVQSSSSKSSDSKADENAGEPIDFEDSYIYKYVDLVNDAMENKKLSFSVSVTKMIYHTSTATSSTSALVSTAGSTAEASPREEPEEPTVTEQIDKITYILNGSKYKRIKNNDFIYTQKINEEYPEGSLYRYSLNEIPVEDNSYYIDIEKNIIYWNIDEEKHTYCTYDVAKLRNDYMNSGYPGYEIGEQEAKGRYTDLSELYDPDDLFSTLIGFNILGANDAKAKNVTQVQVTDDEVIETLNKIHELHFDAKTGMLTRYVCEKKYIDCNIEVDLENTDFDVPDFSAWTRIDAPITDDGIKGIMTISPRRP